MLLSGSSLEGLLEPLISRLPPDDHIADFDASKVSELLNAARNCPLWLADEALKIRLLKLLGRLADPAEMVKQKMPLFTHEVLHGGGVDTALKLAEDLRALCS